MICKDHWLYLESGSKWKMADIREGAIKFNSSNCLPSTSGICQMPSTRPHPAALLTDLRLKDTLCSAIPKPHPDLPAAQAPYCIQESISKRLPRWPCQSALSTLGSTSPHFPALQPGWCTRACMVCCGTHLPGHGGPAEVCWQKQFCTESHCGSQLAG